MLKREAAKLLQIVTYNTINFEITSTAIKNLDLLLEIIGYWTFLKHFGYPNWDKIKLLMGRNVIFAIWENLWKKRDTQFS